jgi:hypothetical protein
MCLVIFGMIFGPRLVIFVWWLLDMARWSATFDNFFLPFLGFLILPWTTIMYVLVAPHGVTGIDWLWMGLAVLADLASLGGGAAQRRSS